MLCRRPRFTEAVPLLAESPRTSADKACERIGSAVTSKLCNLSHKLLSVHHKALCRLHWVTTTADVKPVELVLD